MSRLTIRTAPPKRLAPCDIMDQLGDATLRLASRMASPAKTHQESEDRIHEGERIASAIRRIVRG